MAPKTRAMTGSTTIRKRTRAASLEAQSRLASLDSSDAGATTRQDESQTVDQTNGSPQTPKPRQKRLRFSDPGPNATTGLTPAMGRAGFSGRRRGSGVPTPSRSGRRQSAPIFLSDTLMDPVIARTEPITVQFSPLKQVLDPRTRRRVVRSGLSEEMNKVEREKKDLKKAAAEIESLQKKLEIYESQQASGAHNDNTIFDNYETLPIDDDTMDGTILLSDSPTLYRHRDAHGLSSSNTTSPEDTSPITPHTGYTQPISVMNDQYSEEWRTMAEDLAAIRKEKQDLFNEWRKLNTVPTAGTEAEDVAPPTDFMKQIVPQLEAALKTGSNLSLILDTTTEELLQMGFSGVNLCAILADLRESFESAQQELDHQKSKEEPIPSGGPIGKATLEALIKRLRQVSIALVNEHRKLTEISDHHDNLKRQFDYTVGLYNAEQDKVKKLKESQDTNIDDILHTRMRLQELEQEVDEKATAIKRLNGNLKVVEEERDRFQTLCGQVEEEQHTSKQRIAALETSVSNSTRIADDRSKKMEEFKKLLVDKQEEVKNLSKQVDDLLVENDKLLDRYAQREQEIGRLNTRYADASTELLSTKADLEKTQQLNRMLETHNQEHIAARSRIENFFNTTMTEFSKVFRVEQARDQQNEVTKDVFTGNVARHMQPTPEPSLPSNSPVKALFTNVRLGRGTDRSTLSSSKLGLDSGFGGSETAQSEPDAPAGSDAFLEAIDEEGDGDIE